jgi:hypothetical protein
MGAQAQSRHSSKSASFDDSRRRIRRRGHAIEVEAEYGKLAFHKR